MSASYTLAPLALASLIALAACQPSQSENARREAPALSVSTLSVKPSTEPILIEAIGQTEGAQEVEVRAQVGGVVMARRYVEGAVVKAGEVLFELDRAPLEATLASSRAATREARARLEQTQRERERLEALVKADAASRKELDDARSSEALARAVLEATTAREQDATIRLDWATVRAPTAGIAGRSLVNPGALISAGTTQLTSITQRDSLKVRFALAERDLAGAKLDARSAVTVTPREGGAPVAGKLDFVSTQVDPALGTRTLRATLAPTETLLPGQFVRVNLTIGEQANVFRVPQRAVMQLPDGTYAVYVALDGKAQQRPVSVGQWSGTDWIVTRGLAAGDAVITDQMMRLKPGLAVKLADQGGSKDKAGETSAADAKAAAAPAKN